MDPADECPGGTRICAVKSNYNPAENKEEVTEVRPIAGDYEYSHGRGLSPHLTRLKGSASHSDAEKEGVRVELSGGRFPFDKNSGKPQKAIIEFECDAKRTGLEGLEKGSGGKPVEDDEKDERRMRRRAEGDDDDDEKEPPEKQSSLQLVSYKNEGEEDKAVDVLRLNWKTKYACEGQKDVPSKSKASWGFFTWFLIM